jgi:hypothetical protein
MVRVSLCFFFGSLDKEQIRAREEILSHLAEEVGGAVLVDAQGSPLLLGNAGESGGGGNLQSCQHCQLSRIPSFLLAPTPGEAAVPSEQGIRTLGAAMADAKARLRPSLNIVK